MPRPPERRQARAIHRVDALDLLLHRADGALQFDGLRGAHAAADAHRVDDRVAQRRDEPPDQIGVQPQVRVALGVIVTVFPVRMVMMFRELARRPDGVRKRDHLAPRARAGLESPLDLRLEPHADEDDQVRPGERRDGRGRHLKAVLRRPHGQHADGLRPLRKERPHDPQQWRDGDHDPKDGAIGLGEGAPRERGQAHAEGHPRQPPPDAMRHAVSFPQPGGRRDDRPGRSIYLDGRRGCDPGDDMTEDMGR